MSEKEQMMIGMALGDGHVTKAGSLQITHSSVQKEYLYYKKNLLLKKGIKFNKDTINEPSGYGINQSIRIKTSVTNTGKKIRKYLYPNGVKIIPDDLIITPFMWAILFQDDGRTNKSTHYISHRKTGDVRINIEWVNRYTIYTDCFDLHSIENLQKSLLSYSIESSINYSNKNKHPHIHIRKKESKEKFKQLILPYICESMKYKIDIPTSIIYKN